MSKTKALVVLSGGQDSTTCAFWAKRNFDEVHAITIDYEQRHVREILAAERIASLADLSSHEVIRVGGGLLKSTSPLTSDNGLEQYDNFETMDKIIGDRVEKTFVPMRNTFFLTLAANRAVDLGATHLITGICQADNANYPDCTRAFAAKLESTINESLGLDLSNTHYLSIATPLIDLSKAESIRMAQTIPNAYESLAFSHTSYDGQFPPVGKDHATVLRAHGFEEAGVPDPLVVRAWMFGAMPLPDTANYQDKELIAKLSASIEALGKKLPIRLAPTAAA